MQCGVGKVVNNPFLIANPSVQTGLDSTFAVIQHYFQQHSRQVSQLAASVNELKLQLEDEVNLLEQRMTGKLQIEEAHYTAMMENIGKLNKSIDNLKRKLQRERMWRKKMQADGDDTLTDTDASDSDSDSKMAGMTYG
ncbi:MAG: hypothetical protein CMM02_07580 [Rhodopirellula sp.]|nr:hypothetical protein [Rhodopirellula sp.]